MGKFNDLLIEIGIDTKKAKKELAAIDKMFEKFATSVSSTVKKTTTNSAKESAKVFKDMYKEKEKYAKEYNKELVKQQKKVSKSAKESAKVFQEQQKQAEIVARRLERIKKMEESLHASKSFRSLGEKDQKEILKRFDSIANKFKETGRLSGFKTLSADIRDFKRDMVGLQTVQNGLTDSTRNMVRAYASLFALMEGTQAIERIGMDFQGMEVAMLASAGSSEKASKDLEFVNKIADDMGTNLKDTADAYVKLQMASRGKMDDKQIKELFLGLTEFGTALKVAPESMKLAQRSLSQMASKGQIMAI